MKQKHQNEQFCARRMSRCHSGRLAICEYFLYVFGINARLRPHGAYIQNETNG